MSLARICELVVGGSRANWALVGINFSHDGVFAIGEIALRIDESLPSGMHSWVLSNIDSTINSIDGIATSVIAVKGRYKQNEENGFVLTPLGIDHIVVNTPDLERTSHAFQEATGAELKRIRDAGNSVRQGFHRLGDVIIEIVSAPSMPAGNATLWGFVLNVADVHEVARYLGPDVLSPPKPAVQKNRLIATFRGAVGLGVPVALMSDI
jgi:catechol 2,3-dioxygenase-like lactoylglutathione lyase family enzyme